MTSVNIKNTHIKKSPREKTKLYSILTFIIFFFFLILLSSCQSSFWAREESKNSTENSSNGSDRLYSVSEEDCPLYYFDYKKIKIDKAGSIDVKIIGCNLYLDIYGDLVLLGEIENNSSVTKTDMEITFDFYDKHGKRIASNTEPSIINYLRSKSKLPFIFYLEDREKYIDINRVKIGVNYKNYYEKFKGNPVVKNEQFYYEDDKLIIEGKVINLGKNRVEDLKLLYTFYNERDQVVFIKHVSLPASTLDPLGEQKFTLEVLLDEYLRPFTHYRPEIFFEDSLGVLAEPVSRDVSGDDT